MNRTEESRPETTDEPLCVLRYRIGAKIVLTMGLLFFIIPFGCWALFVHAARSVFELIMVKYVGVFFLWFILPSAVERLLTKEIQLYKDKITKEWHSLGVREIQLAEAGLVCGWQGGKYFFEKDKPRSWHWLLNLYLITGLGIDDGDLEARQVKEMNRLLAELSGRKVWEFQQPVTMERLMKSKKP